MAVGINTSYAEFKKMLLSQQYLDNVPELLSIIYRETEDKQFSWNDLEKYLEEKLYDKAFTENLEKYKEIKFCKIENRLTNFYNDKRIELLHFQKILSLSSKVCKFFDFFVVVDKSTTIFTSFNQTEVLHLWILSQMFCEYTGQLNLLEQGCLLLSVKLKDV